MSMLVCMCVRMHWCGYMTANTVGDAIFLGDVEKAGARVLKDYRTGALGWVCLEPPPV